MRFPDAEILVMARAPVTGEAKTRLIPALGEEGAAQLHAWLVERLLRDLTEADIAHVTLCCTPALDHPFFIHCRQKYGVTLQPQHGSNLGERLYTALKRSLEKRRFALVVGCDIPLLGAAAVSASLKVLADGADAALIPAEDGGYALLALQRASHQLFEAVEWGGAQVMAQTRDRLGALEWKWEELPTLWDLDRPGDLPRLARLPLPPQIRNLLQGLSLQSDHQSVEHKQQC